MSSLYVILIYNLCVTIWSKHNKLIIYLECEFEKFISYWFIFFCNYLSRNGVGHGVNKLRSSRTCLESNETKSISLLVYELATSKVMI